MHNESVMVALVSLGLLAAVHKRFHIGLILIGVAVALKASRPRDTRATMTDSLCMPPMR